MKKEAMLYEKAEDSKVNCALCAHRCKISPSKRGVCGVRENLDGTLYTLVYGALIAENIDPIEKKPLFHIHPGSQCYSIAAMGCNFRCTFCQNHEISQLPRETGEIFGREASPESIVSRAIQSNAKTIAYTYTEPTIFFEYAFDIAKIAHDRGLKNIFVTNGYMTEESLETMAPYLDAANVDLKSFRDAFYKEYCGARLQPVLDTLTLMKRRGIWIEITTLLIPDLNDSSEELTQIADFISNLGTDTPWHISRFQPRYKMKKKPQTALDAIHRSVEIGKKSGLKYVYCGNVPGDEGENTSCANCGRELIRRLGYQIVRYNLKESSCPHCGTALDGIF
jgi:pyruvate formate lyase activating enzyme